MTAHKLRKLVIERAPVLGRLLQELRQRGHPMLRRLLLLPPARPACAIRCPLMTVLSKNRQQARRSQGAYQLQVRPQPTCAVTGRAGQQLDRHQSLSRLSVWGRQAATLSMATKALAALSTTTREVTVMGGAPAPRGPFCARNCASRLGSGRRSPPARSCARAQSHGLSTSTTQHRQWQGFAAAACRRRHRHKPWVGGPLDPGRDGPVRHV